MIELNKLYQGDAFELIKDIPDNSIDLVLTDPPYSINDGKNSRAMMLTGNRLVSADEAVGLWDTQTDEKSLEFMIRFCDASLRVLKEGGSLIFFYNRDIRIPLTEFHKKFYFKHSLVFTKTNPGPHFRENNYRNAHEIAYWFVKDNKGKPNVFNFLSQQEMKDVFTGNIGGKKYTEHPTEKPLWMIENLLLRHSQQGNVVLDMFTGSATIPVCCIRYECDFIAFEKNAEYFKQASERVEKEFSLFYC